MYVWHICTPLPARVARFSATLPTPHRVERSSDRHHLQGAPVRISLLLRSLIPSFRNAFPPFGNTGKCPSAVELRPFCVLFVKMPKTYANLAFAYHLNATKLNFCCVRGSFRCLFGSGIVSAKGNLDFHRSGLFSLLIRPFDAVADVLFQGKDRLGGHRRS